ncbi:hypothetical protein CVT25_013912 [Psilocybe cyanescens]|uniref:Uncharacterized protein n=1 Tax=Psilocybe cyanescens TaxID=93625 RepID=A0A409XRD5_PSICY|nr:hypothetical protein CVT25_013912 [Psilocybe cyanescens]
MPGHIRSLRNTPTAYIPLIRAPTAHLPQLDLVDMICALVDADRRWDLHGGSDPSHLLPPAPPYANAAADVSLSDAEELMPAGCSTCTSASPVPNTLIASRDSQISV